MIAVSSWTAKGKSYKGCLGGLQRAVTWRRLPCWGPVAPHGAPMAGPDGAMTRGEGPVEKLVGGSTLCRTLSSCLSAQLSWFPGWSFRIPSLSLWCLMVLMNPLDSLASGSTACCYSPLVGLWRGGACCWNKGQFELREEQNLKFCDTFR